MVNRKATEMLCNVGRHFLSGVGGFNFLMNMGRGGGQYFSSHLPKSPSPSCIS